MEGILKFVDGQKFAKRCQRKKFIAEILLTPNIPTELVRDQMFERLRGGKRLFVKACALPHLRIKNVDRLQCEGKKSWGLAFDFELS